MHRLGSPWGVLGIGSNEGEGLIYLSGIPDLRFHALQAWRCQHGAAPPS
jgi:hypothetical protein